MADAIHVAEVVIDPKWSVSTITIDGAPHIILSMEHPRHGRLDSIIEKGSAMKMRAALASALGTSE